MTLPKEGDHPVRKEKDRARCAQCGHPELWPEEWDTVEEGGLPDLCWGDPIVCWQFQDEAKATG